MRPYGGQQLTTGAQAAYQRRNLRACRSVY